jgi:hypothetical protein
MKTPYKLQVLSDNTPGRLKPADKVYYSKYPYKVRLRDNIVFYDSSRWGEILDWYMNLIDREQKYEVSIRTAFSRIVYFSSKELLEEFKFYFDDQIVEMHGPISKAHIKMLKKKQDASKNKNYTLQYELRKQKWFGEYDTKAYFFAPYSRALGQYSRRLQESSDALETAIKVVEDYKLYGSLRRTRFMYMQESEFEDLQLFIKLKHPQIQLFKTSALVIR